MAATVVQSKTAAQNTAITSHTVSLNSAAVAGNEIIITFASDAYVNSGDIPAGFTEPTGARQEFYLGHYIWRKTAVGGETSFTVNTSVACSAVWGALEVSGLSGAGSLLGSSGQGIGVNGANSSTYTTPTLTLTAGDRFVVGSIGGSYSGSGFTTISGWTNSFTEVIDNKTTLSSGTRDSVGLATRALTATAGQTISTAGTWDGGIQPESRTSIILAFNVGSVDTTAPSVPTGFKATKRTSDSVSLSWDASTDNVSVSNYDVQVNGVAYKTTTTTSITVYGLSENTSYQFRVRARDSAGNYSAFTSNISLKTLTGSGSYTWTGSTKQLMNTILVDPSKHYSTLSRVPWEGGPSYYASYPGLTAWNNPNFFPIGYWGAYADQQAYITRYKDLGINLLWSTYNNVANSASWIRTAGLYNLGASMAGSGSEHVGYVLEDEVDMWAGAGWGGWNKPTTGFVPNVCTSGNADCGYTVMKGTNDDLPVDGKLRWTNYGMTLMTFMDEGQATDLIKGGNATATWPMDIVTADMYFYTGAGALLVDTQTHFGVDPIAVRRAGNYGEIIMKKIRRLDGNRGNRKPLGVIVELGGQTQNGEEMTPDKVEGAVWSTLIHEARCISYFSHAFAQTTNNPYSTNCLYDGSGLYPQIQTRVGQINSQVTQLAPVLNTQSYTWTGANNIESMMKIQGGYAYIFAMAKVEVNHSSDPRPFVLPYGLSGRTAEVMFESRTLPIRNGTIHDAFTNETTHHIYKIAV